MNRLTRLATRFNSPESKLLFTRLQHQSNAVRFSPPLSLSLRQFSTTTPPADLGAGTQDSVPIRKVLPQELLSKNVVKLTCESSAKVGLCDVYLVGTRHFSKESCREVEAVISYLKPEVVFLELCQSRKGLLTNKNFKAPTVEQIAEVKKNEDYALLFRMAWTKAAVDSGIKIHESEFRVAYEEAIKYGGKVILGDRPMKITLKRTWGKMSHWDKIKLPFSLISLALRKKHIEQRMTSEKMPFWRRIMPISLSFQKDLPSQKDLKKVVKERLDDVNGEMLALMMEEIKKRFPTVVETCIHERDLYMSYGLLNIARKHSSVVAVVGKGHLQGIKKHWKQPIVLKELLEITSEKAAVSGACKDT